VNHQRRYGKPFEAFLDASKNIGELLSVDITQPMANVLDFGPHLVDAALYVMGKERQAVSVFAAVDQSDPGQWQGISTESQLLGTAHFNDGSRILMEAGKDHCGKLPILRVNGSLGFAELHLEPAPDVTNVFRACLAGSSEITSLETSEHFHHSEDPALYMKRAVKDIRDALNTGIETRIDASEACRGIEILLGFFESAKSGKLLKL
jgi:predicted dehydrogenase